MMAPSEKAKILEANCLDCGVTKMYYNMQGVDFFKEIHKGHNVSVKNAPHEGPRAVADEVKGAPVQEMEAAGSHDLTEMSLEQVKPVSKRHGKAKFEEDQPRTASSGNVVSLRKLVVDLVEEARQRTFKVYGIANSTELFEKVFEMDALPEMKEFIRAGRTTDQESGQTYVWSQEAVDMSYDVKGLIGDIMPAENLEEDMELAEVPREESKPKVIEAKPVKAPVVEQVKVAPKKPTEALLMARFGYLEEGDEHFEEAKRVSKALKEFRWNVEPPYMISAIFDNVLSIQSRTGTMSASVIQKIESIGYKFVAVEAPKGKLTVYFKRAPAEEGSAQALDDMTVDVMTYESTANGSKLDSVAAPSATAEPDTASS
jgi:hypothetical protein